MGEQTKIEWTDRTFNPWVGCTKISPACDHCYAESWAKRAGSPELWTGERRRTTSENWRQPLKWDQQSAAQVATGRRRLRVFCASLADVFDNQVPAEWRADLRHLISQTPHLDWQLLTKRPQNIARMLPPDWADGWHNVWLGTTVEDQERADRNIPHLLDVPAAVRFLSIEPLLGPIQLESLPLYTPFASHFTQFRDVDPIMTVNALTGLVTGVNEYHGKIDWVIVGGESGAKARPMHPDWVRALLHQSIKTGVPFFFKQWGEWAPTQRGSTHLLARDGYPTVGTCESPLVWRHRTHVPIARLGKKIAGRTLDGATHDAMPRVRS